MQTQYLHIVVQMLIDHIDAVASIDLRVVVASTLAAIIGIAAQSIGPALLEIFNNLLRHLRTSVERTAVV